ncbi:MAG TPA: ABC transporter permease subunit [Candidatus Limnocylindrales bacterium]|jgi:ABC-type transport system involved in multi-copper enzyme maturation permease subunit|nr:ABC transporter permease subunit [Candidatus Limnocylindrales bacterium]
MNRVLFVQTWRSQRVKILVVGLGLAIWGSLMPIIYGTFGQTFKSIIDSGLIPEELTQFGGGDIFSLSGALALGAIHPISLILNSIFAVGFATAAVAGERQRGTLEVLLARPLSRRGTYLTLLAATLSFVAVAVAATILGAIVGSIISGVSDELVLARLPVMWLNGFLLFGAIGAIGLAASVSFDRLTPALGITVAIVVVMYFLEVLGTFWPDAQVLQPYSVFHYYNAKAILEGTVEIGDFVLLAVVGAVALAWALVEFPRRDLAAPS